jgi:hypothetical protein
LLRFARNDLPQAVIARLQPKQSSRIITALAVLSVVVAFVIGIGVGNSASADPTPNPSGTSIPVKKGGTGSTTEQGALQNLLPDFDSNNGKVLGSTGTEIGWVEQTKSSDDIGKVKIDSTDKTMTTNGDIGVNGTSKVSINRPDLWTANVEYDFGSGLYGKRFTGVITQTSADGLIDTQLTDYRVLALVGYGGWWNFGEGTKAAVNSINMNFNDVTQYFFAIRIKTENQYLIARSISGNNRTSAPYDVWVTYTKYSD